MLRNTIFIVICLISSSICRAQVEIAHVNVKGFSSTGFGVFLNFSQPISQASTLTLEGGLQYFVNRFSEDLGLIPVVLGYRYTLGGNETGIYVEPAAGYNLGSSTIAKFNTNRSPVVDANGNQVYEKVSGPVAGLGVGYLLPPVGRFQFNVGLHYKYTFADARSNVLALRVAHSFSFSRRDSE